MPSTRFKIDINTHTNPKNTPHTDSLTTKKLVKKNHWLRQNTKIKTRSAWEKNTTKKQTYQR